jgi:hypothetical protein
MTIENGNQVAGLADVTKLSISEIAEVVHKDWKNIPEYAKAYSVPMLSLVSINENYYEDTGKSVVAYFLANASGWRGETAKAIKKELNRRLK